MDEKRNDSVITSYPEGLEYLAEHLELPFRRRLPATWKREKILSFP